jgi:hypothetical protein
LPAVTRRRRFNGTSGSPSGRTGYPYQLTPYGTDLRDTRGMWQKFAEVLPRIWP